MSASLELRYLRDGAAWALDAVLRSAGHEKALPRQYLGESSGDTLESVITAFTIAYDRGLQAADSAGSSRLVAPNVSDALRYHVIPAAERLAAFLFPPAIHSALTSSKAHRIEIVYDADLQQTPFEAAWWHGDFLGFQFAVSRRMITRRRGNRPRPPVSTPPRCAVVADPGGLLRASGRSHSASAVGEVLSRLRDGWTDEMERRIELAPSSCRISEPITPEQVNRLLAGHEIFVLLSHHETDQRDATDGRLLGPGRGVQIAADQYYSGDDLLRAFGPTARVPWLVCWPCCESGASESWQRSWRQAGAATPAASLADAALQLDVPHFIGTLFQVHAEYVVHFVGPLLAALDDSFPVAEALRRARCALRGPDRENDPVSPGTLAGLALIHLGDGSAALVSSAGNRLDHDDPPPRVMTCEEPVSGRACGRAVSAEESGHHRRRCARHFVEEDKREGCCSAGHRGPVAQLIRCGHDGCDNTFCSQCRTAPFSRCWRHAGASGLIEHEWEGQKCSDPFELHPQEPRMVGIQDVGFASGLCQVCWQKQKDGLRASLCASTR